MPLRVILSPAAVLFVSDCAAVFASCLAGFFLRFVTSGGDMEVSRYLDTIPWLALFPLFYLVFGLYPGAFLRRHEALKYLTIATSAGFIGLAFISFLVKEGHAYSRLALLLSWAFAVAAVPLARFWARRRFGCRPWWATPCVMFGNGGRVSELCDALSKARPQGLKPAVLVLDDHDPLPDLGESGSSIPVERIPLANPEQAREALNTIALRYARAYAVISFDSSDTEKRQDWLSVIDRCFQRIILIPDMSVGGRIWVRAVSIGRLAGLMLRQNLLDPRRMAVKRAIDLVCTVTGGVIAFPLLFALAVAVRCDSKGPVLFRQRRIGRGGRHFTVYKFRTMAVNAAELLEKHLAENEDARAEWKADHKLRNDPRVTRVGRFLRKTSLDELPQLINVLKGDMSIVGPRPIVDEEIKKYGPDYELYTRVRPGITGLWQTSGRNDLSYADRVWLDRHYVCNWSVWLDILIVIRTVPEVLHCSGAY